MSMFGTPGVAAVAARVMQLLVRAGTGVLIRRVGAVFPEITADTHDITIPTTIAPARAVVYRPRTAAARPPVHVNFHGGGFVLPGSWIDDPLCRYLATEAGVIVVNVDYVVAPRHRFPAPARQAFDVVEWVADHGADHGWDGGRITVGGQSAGGALAAAAARQALERGGPRIALQALHYPVLDLTVPAREKSSTIAKPMLRPWMGDVFDHSYVPGRVLAADRLASPAAPSDTADLTGIAPALVITPEYDLLHAEGLRYAQRLRRVGALREHHDVARADHGYDVRDHDKAREVYALIAEQVRAATARD